MTAKKTKGARATPRPFLKWVGGKGQLLPELLKRVQAAEPFERYHEPFVGGGALFFQLCRTRRFQKKAWLSDNNERLVETYEGVKDDVEALIELLRSHKEENVEKYYYSVRANVPKTTVQRAARIIYLNKTCYNGLFRENSKGEFNTPFGRYKNPGICDEENLRKASEALAWAKIEARSFETVVRKAREGDLVYFDPPYHPLSRTASFTAYDKNGFGTDSQRRLADVCAELTEKGVKFILSNSMTDLVKELYPKSLYTFDRVQAKRSVNSRADRRGKISEALIHNLRQIESSSHLSLHTRQGRVDSA